MSLTKKDLEHIEELFDRKFDRKFEGNFEQIIVPFVDGRISQSESKMIQRMDEQFLALHEKIDNWIVEIGQYMHDTPTRKEFDGHEKRLKKLEAIA